MPSRDNQFIQLRRQKLEKLLAAGIEPYPIKSFRTHKIEDILKGKDDWVASNQEVSLAGRLVAMRRQGKLSFGDLEDASGKIQIYVAQNLVGEENYELFKLCDPGDFIQVKGTLFFTQAGEYSLRANQISLLAKNLRPLPPIKEKVIDGKLVRYSALSDVEIRYRKRYLDLLLNPSHRDIFIRRAKIISAIRSFLDEREFIEVETPILQPLYGGANARPFITHHNALDIDLYLRIATELYLKRLIVGGFEKIYELGKDFRNEGMDRIHNPEFTMLELYEAYSDLAGMMDLTESLLKYLAINVLHQSIYKFRGYNIDLSEPFQKASMQNLLKDYLGLELSEDDYDKAVEFCQKHNIDIPPGAGTGKLIYLIYENMIEEQIIQPTFVTDFPKEVSPLAKAKPDNPFWADRFELLIAGYEFANAFSELNDPLEQRARLEAQAALRALGDEEASVVDEDFLEALEYGMPPMGGLGIGIDRLVMLLTENDSIKEVILFPQMKPEQPL
jgi:lysyl-tRNA synthetase class 2